MFRPLRMLRQHFNPLSLYRERRLYPVVISFFKTFQSTLPIQGETVHDIIPLTLLIYFNPLSLYRERLTRRPARYYVNEISIHSPYTGRDYHILLPVRCRTISIHSPYTGRDSNFAHKAPNIQPISYAKRQTKELFPTPTQQIITSLALISSISRCESPCIFMCTSHSH